MLSENMPSSGSGNAIVRERSSNRIGRKDVARSRHSSECGLSVEEDFEANDRAGRELAEEG